MNHSSNFCFTFEYSEAFLEGLSELRKKEFGSTGPPSYHSKRKTYVLQANNAVPKCPL